MSSVAVPRAAVASPWARILELALPVAMIAAILVILVPVPAALMDLLLAANMAVAVVMLLTTLYVQTPLEFNVFPSLLLATTLFRLVLNIATTRLILTRAAVDGPSAAGGVVRTFGEFVTGAAGAAGADKIIVGLIIFTIIVLVQFVVITKGATRMSEVAARFTLDGMPGKQMAIDADLGAGTIDAQEAQRRRDEIFQQADFFGAMDGASKFVRGDAIAGIAIILINITGGLWIGVVHAGMGLGEAASVFTTLTIGDGLVTQVPAFLISLAAGMLITRSHRKSNLPVELARQVFSSPQALIVAGVFLLVLIFTSLPRVPLVLLAAGCVGIAAGLHRRRRADQTAEVKKQSQASKKSQGRVEDYLALDAMELELGVGLLRLADPNRGGDILERIQRVRQVLASEMGVILPKVRVRDNMRLEPNQYRVKIADSAVTQGFIDAAAIDPGRLIAAQLSETAFGHADELITRDAVKHLIDQLRQLSPAVVDELIPGVMKLGEVQQVLQLLLREGVSIRQLGPILETLSDCAPRTREPVALAEHVRRRLARWICSLYRDAQGRLYAITLDPALEERVRLSIRNPEDGLAVCLSPSEIGEICRAIESEVSQLVARQLPPIVLVSPELRPALRQLTAAHLPQLVVLSYAEITRDTRVESVALVADPSDTSPTAGPSAPQAPQAPHGLYRHTAVAAAEHVMSQ
jgi:flagellar biosynthesis protein FlhA